jgi:glyoxylate/hydroxypyruvate reductase A
MTLAFYSRSDDPAEWRAAFATALPDLRFVTDTEIDDPATVRYALVWKPPHGWLAGFPNLRAIFSLGAGVDALLDDPTLPPDLPLTRMVDAGMGRQMAEYAAWGVLHFHRGMQRYLHQQQAREWRPHPGTPARQYRVGLLGLGVLGEQAARLIVATGYPVAAWTRTPRQVAGVENFAGTAALPAFLARTHVLINFLPLTPDTRGVLDARLFAQLPRGAAIVNLARGPHLVDADLLAALDADHLSGALLDVFHTEPLATDHPFWRHPKIVVTPHVAAITIADEAAAQVIENVRRMERGEAPLHTVDRARGY